MNGRRLTSPVKALILIATLATGTGCQSLPKCLAYEEQYTLEDCNLRGNPAVCQRKWSRCTLREGEPLL